MVRLARIALVAGGLLAVALAAGAAGGPDPNVQAQADGCARDRGAIFTKEVPNWVYVGDKDVPAAAAPSTGVTHVTGVVNSAFEPDRAAEPTGTDDPFTHTSYDFTFNLKPDAAYASLLGAANFSGNNEETARLHIERESGTFPTFAWPNPGDRLELNGSWVWDCDHFAPSGEHTEIHPFNTIWVERRHSPSSRFGDSEGDLFATDAGTPADTQAVCAHETKGDRLAFQRCLASPVGLVPVPAFQFVVRPPPRPSSSARLVYRVVDHGSNHPVFVRRVSGGIAVMGLEDTIPDNRPFVIAKQVFVGWRPMPVNARPVHLRVSLVRLLVRRAMDPGCPLDHPECPNSVESTRVGQYTTSPGEWNVYVNAGGVWAPWKPILIHPRDGQAIPGRQNVDFYVARGAAWRLFVQTRECDFTAVGNAYTPAQPVAPCPRGNEIGNPVGDDEPGIVADHFHSPAAGLGLHRSNSQLAGSTCPTSNRHGCYQLTYRVSRVRVSSGR